MRLGKVAQAMPVIVVENPPVIGDYEAKLGGRPVSAILIDKIRCRIVRKIDLLIIGTALRDRRTELLVIDLLREQEFR